MDREEMRRRVEAARVAHLASVRPDGRPHVTPIVFALGGETLYTAVDPKPKRSRRLQRLENIRAEPRVEVVVDGYEEDWSRVWWVRLGGSAEVVETGPELERGHTLLRARYPQYGEDAELGEVIAVRIERWTGWSSS